jgi:hypothetical protein
MRQERSLNTPHAHVGLNAQARSEINILSGDTCKLRSALSST